MKTPHLQVKTLRTPRPHWGLCDGCGRRGKLKRKRVTPVDWDGERPPVMMFLHPKCFGLFPGGRWIRHSFANGPS